jgi:RNA 2',3'-cyclic 3'-phosphodiesterase
LSLVAKERQKSPRVRLFVALDLPGPIREGILEWGRGALTDPGLRPTPPQALHITLAFLGWSWERDIPRLAEIVHGIQGAAPSIRLLPEPVAVPRRPRETRLFALDAPSEGAVDLQGRLEERLVAARLYKPEKRPFWSHVTVARVRKERGDRRRYMTVRAPPGPIPETLRAPFLGVRVTLYRSVLRPAGAEYTQLAQVELPASTGVGQR